MRPRICLATPEFPPGQRGGLALTAARVARAAAGCGLEVHVAHLAVRDGVPPLLDANRVTRREDGLTVHRIEVGAESPDPAQRQRWDCAHTLTLRMMHQSLDLLHREHGFALLHAFFLFPVGYAAVLLARRTGIPCLVTMVGDDLNRFMFSPAKVAPLIYTLQNADRVASLSRQLVEAAQALTPLGDRARVIHNSVALPEAAQRPAPRDGRPFRVGCAGFFKYSKGLPYLLTAVARLARDRPVRLELMGGFKRGQRAQLDHWTRQTGIADSLRLVEPVEHAGVPAWLGGLDAFALPSVSEGCPNILMEAMACGLPCVAARVGACPELVEHGVSGLLVPWADSAALAEALARLIDDPAAAAAMGARARLAMERFSPESEALAWRALYGELLELPG